MERSDSLIKLVSVLVLLALVCYIGISFYTRETDPLRTVMAVEMSLSDYEDTQGYAVRTEQRINSAGTATVVAEDGAKVSKGSVIARSYKGSEALRRAAELRSLEVRLDQLETLIEEGTGVESARESIINLSRVISSGDLTGLEAAAFSVRATVMGEASGDEAELRAELQSIQAEITRLSAVGGSEPLTSPAAGVFSSVVDGFENITPKDLGSDLMPSELYELFGGAQDTRTSFGKVITGIKWYYATVVDADIAGRLAERSTVKVEFSRTYSASVTMDIVSVGPVADGKCVAVLSCDRYMQQVAGLRDLTGRIVFSTNTGIRVPSEAVHVSAEGETFIYVLEGMQAEEVKVNILGQDGNDYLVEKTAGGLDIGDEIITRANGLSDGAVVLK